MTGNSEMFKSVVTASVEKALLEVGVLELDLVTSRLKEDYNCDISDCLDHPEYLKEILNDLFGKSYNEIMKSINKSFEKTNMEKPLENFLTVMNHNH